MAFRVANGNGNWSAAGTWWTAANTPTIHTSTNLTINTTGIFTQPFTAAASVDTITGVVVCPVASWSGKTVTFTLQAGGVDTATSVAITGADVALNQPLFVKLAVPVAQVATTVYRFRISTNTGTCTIAQSATASQAAAIITNNVTGAPASGDSMFICCPNANTDIDVTLDDTTAVCGNNSVLSLSGSFLNQSARYYDMALQVAGGANNIANLVADPSANTRLTWQNNVTFFANGKFTQKPNAGFTSEVRANLGTIGSPSASIQWINFSQGSLSDIQGVGLSTAANWKSKFVSGLGTAASPLAVTAGTGSEWSVGDYIVLVPTSNNATNYNEVEYRYIISKPTADTMVVSSTSGGSENALIYSHTGGYIFNNDCGKNVRWYSADTSLYHMGYLSTSATSANNKLRWVKMQNTYSSGSSIRGGLGLPQSMPLIEYISLSTPGVTTLSQLMYIALQNPSTSTIKGLFAFNGNTTSSNDGIINTFGINKTFEDCWLVDVLKTGYSVNAAATAFKQSGVIAGSAALPLNYGAFLITASAIQLNDCEVHCYRAGAFLWYSTSTQFVATRFLSGTKGNNGFLSTGNLALPSLVEAYFDTLYTTSTNYLDVNALIEGSQIVISNINGTAYDNTKITNNGKAVATGTGLTDTTLSPLGNRTYRHDPTTAVGIKYRYNQIASVNSNFLTYGKVWGNSTFVTDPNTTVTVDLYLPGTVEGVDTPSATTTMTKTTTASSAQAQYSLTAFYPGTRPQLATVVVTATNPSATPSANVYIGDILNARNDTTNFSLMTEGQPAEVMPETAGESGAIATAVVAGVWNDTNTYGVGSKGKNVKDGSKAKIVLNSL